MKTMWLAAIVAISINTLSMGSADAQSMEFREGTHYEVLNDEPAKDTEVLEFFSFYCNACFQYQPFARMLEEEFGDDFKKYHVDFLATADMGESIVQAWATATVLDVKEDVSRITFQQHFARRQMTNSMDGVRDIFAAAGVDREKFDATFNSFAVRSLTNRMRREARTYNVQSTPTYIINGKYRMIPQGFRDSGNQFFDHYLELARYLVEKD